MFIKTFNQERWIRRCVESVLSQRHVEGLVVLVWDDCSNDGTFELLLDLERRYRGKLFLISPSKNSFADARGAWVNEFQELHFDFLALLEGDDFYSSDTKLADQIEIFRTHHRVTLVHSDYFVLIDGQDAPQFSKPNLLLRHKLPLASLVNNSFQTCTVLYRGNMVDPQLCDLITQYGVGDVFVNQRYLKRGKPYFLPVKTAVYRVHAQSFWSSQELKAQLRTMIRCSWQMLRLPSLFSPFRVSILISAQIVGLLQIFLLDAARRTASWLSG